MQCNDCGKILPGDSEFCQYCGSKNISKYIQPKQTQSVSIKKCAKCGKELPEDSEFCQYCGSNEIELKKVILEQKTKNNDAEIAKHETKSIEVLEEKSKTQITTNFKIPFIIAIITAFALIIGLLYLLNDRNTIVNEYNELYLEKQEIKSILKIKENNNKDIQNSINTYKRFYDTIVYSDPLNIDDITKTINSGYGSEPRMFVSETVLINPKNSKVSVYLHVNRQYEINWEYNSYALDVKSDNTQSGLVSLEITYKSGSKGVEPITISNSITGEKITIFCIKK